MFRQCGAAARGALPSRQVAPNPAAATREQTEETTLELCVREYERTAMTNLRRFPLQTALAAGAILLIVVIVGVLYWRYSTLHAYRRILDRVEDCRPRVEWEGTKPVAVCFADPIANFNLSDEDVATLAELGTLRVLLIHSAPHLTDAVFQHCSKLTELWDLHICFAPIGKSGLASLASLPKLRTLNLTGTDLTDTELAELPRFPTLTDANLSSTKITDKGLAPLAQSTSLQRVFLTIDGVKTTEAGTSLLQKQAPLLEVSTRLDYRHPRDPLPAPAFLGDSRSNGLPVPEWQQGKTPVMLAEVKEGARLTQLMCFLSEDQLAVLGVNDKDASEYGPALFNAIKNRLPTTLAEWFSERDELPKTTATVTPQQLQQLLRDRFTIKLSVGCLWGDSTSRVLVIE